MKDTTKAAISYLVQSGIVNANTGKVDYNRIAKTGISVPFYNSNRGGGSKHNASGKNGSRNGK